MSRLIDADAPDFLNEMRSRQEACKKLIAEADGEHKTWTEKDHWEGVYAVFVEMALVIKAQPAIEAEPVRRGKWILHDVGDGFPWWECSVCHADGRGDYNYCPFCGAKNGG